MGGLTNCMQIQTLQKMSDMSIIFAAAKGAFKPHWQSARAFVTILLFIVHRNMISIYLVNVKMFKWNANVNKYPSA
jgi:hypothetical protein